MKNHHLFFTLVLVLFQQALWATESFPVPGGWEANLENVRVSDVISEMSPSSEIGAEIEAKYKSILKKRGFLYNEGEGSFSILTPSVLCRAPYVPETTAASSPQSLTSCQISLTLKEYVVVESPPRKKEGKRMPRGIVGTFYAHYAETFPQDKATITKALDHLFDKFLAAVTHQSQTRH